MKTPSAPQADHAPHANPEQRPLACDLLVAGAGMAGICAAIAGGRQGLRTILVEKEMFLGGNAGPNLGVGSLGVLHGNPFWHETGIVEEIEARTVWHLGRTAPGQIIYNTNPLWDTLVAEPLREANVTVLRKHLVLDASLHDGRIPQVTILNIETLAQLTVAIDGFVVDATGNADVAMLAGAEYRMGREGREETGERSAPDRPDELISAASVTALTVDVGQDVPFVPPPGTPVWNPDKPANTFSPARRVNILFQVDEGGESATNHPLLSPQALHERLVRRVYSLWDHCKNRLYPEAARTHQLIWISPILGRRESRRVVGDYLLTQTDIESGRRFPDAVAFGGFPLDFHPPSTDGGYECIYYSAPLPFDIPLRCLYSRNVHNLFTAGRNISTTHLAFASIRVQRTGGVIGQAVATAAAYCLKHGKQPANLTPPDVHAIQQNLLRQDAFLPGLRNEDSDDLARHARITASSEATAGVPESVDLSTVTGAAPPAPNATTAATGLAALPSGAWRNAAAGLGVAVYAYPPAVRRASFFIRNPHRQPVPVTASLACGATPQPGHLHPDWPRTKPYRFRHPGRIEHPHFGDALETVSLTVAAGFEGWLDAPFNHNASLPSPCRNVFAQALLLGLEGDVDVLCLPPWMDVLDPYQKLPGDGWRASDRQHQTLPAFRIEPDPLPGRAANVVDGVPHREGIGVPHQWTSAPGQSLPQWLELSFDNEIAFTLIHLKFDVTERYSHAMPWDSGLRVAPRLVADYTLEAFADGHWTALVAERDNFQRFRVHRLPSPARARRVRLTIARVWGAGEPARVYEVRLYSSPEPAERNTLSCWRSTVMTSREIVRRCIEFKEPSRIGWHFQTDPIQGRTWNESDFASIGYAVDPRFGPKPGETEWVTEWGIRRRRINTAVGEAVGFPLAEGWHLLETYAFPNFADPSRYAHLKNDVPGAHAAGKYVIGHIPSLMLLPIDLRGMENWFLDNAMEQENLARLMDRLLLARETIIEHYHAAGVDGVMTWDDMGTNAQPFVSPATFRQLYYPRYRRTIDFLHERGMHFVHHCCGQVREYLELFIEAGCDVLQLDQPELMGVDWLADHGGGRLCFWNCVDIQRTIGSGDLDLIEDEAHRQVWRLGQFGGGFMVKAYQQPESIGMTVAQAQRQFEAFTRYASYPLTPYQNKAPAP